MEKPGHLIVLASAGVGKTYKLVKRAIDLLFRGIPPTTVVIITFTRKAAQEIVDRLFSILAQQILSEACEEKLVSPHRLKAILTLKTLIDHLPYLHFETIDSFFYKLLNHIPPEKRATFVNFSLLDDFQQLKLREEILWNVLNSETLDDSIVEAFEQVFGGEDLKNVFSKYLALVEKYYPFFQDFPQVEYWGAPNLFYNIKEITLNEDFLSLIAHIENLLKTEGIPTRLWDEQKKNIRSFPTLYQNLLKAYDPDLRQCFQLTLDRKKYNLSSPLALSLGKLAELTIAFFLEKSHERTRGIAQLLQLYDRHYRKKIKTAAVLSFEDMPRVILEAFGLDLPNPFFFNLDKKWDHFLIDEFQDTSLLQWKVIKLFVDELLQNDDGSRSFFCVGDPKQSIYGWRGACGELIDSIVSLFHLEKQELKGSRRSAGAILDMVNRLFGNFELIEELFPECVEIWKKRWTIQDCFERKLEGYGCLLCVKEPSKEKDFSLENSSNEEIEEKQAEQVVTNTSMLRFEAIKRLLIDEIKPQEKKLSCAILVQTNKEAADIFHYLSTCSTLKVSLEGKIYPGKDNRLAKFFSALVQSIAHPNDSLALGWLQASPLGDIFREESWRKNIWEKLFMGGFLEVASWLFAVLEKKIQLDDFHKERMAMIFRICQSFDTTGSRDCDLFLDYFKNYSIPICDDPSSIQIRTVHSAKGLEFDVVLITELKGSYKIAMNQPRDQPIMYQSPEKEKRIFFLPKREVIEKVPNLKAVYKKLVGEEALEKISLLYVAMTRARQGLYIVGEMKEGEWKKSSKKRVIYWQDFLIEGLNSKEEEEKYFFDDFPLLTLFESGKRNWIPQEKKGNQIQKASIGCSSQDLLFLPRPIRRDNFISPSLFEKQTQNKSLSFLFNLEREKNKEYGRKIHGLFGRLERLTDPFVQSLQKLALEYKGKDTERNPFQDVLECLQTPEIRKIFTPPEDIDIWIERNFCLEVEGLWIKGSFDRVHLKVGSDKGISCEIYDFKTDLVFSLEGLHELAKKYHCQLMLYRKALCKLLQIEPSQVKVFLVSVHLKKMIELFQDV